MDHHLYCFIAADIPRYIGQGVAMHKKRVKDWISTAGLRAGHGIRTRDFNLGKVALYH